MAKWRGEEGTVKTQLGVGTTGRPETGLRTAIGCSIGMSTLYVAHLYAAILLSPLYVAHLPQLPHLSIL